MRLMEIRDCYERFTHGYLVKLMMGFAFFGEIGFGFVYRESADMEFDRVMLQF